MKEDRKHKVCATPAVMDAVDALAKLNRSQGRLHATRSALIEAECKRMLRKNANRLRKAGVKLPDEVFTR